jgi:hypothetical protein
MATDTYNILFTNKSDTIVIEPYDVDISTSLVLYGKNTLNYWTDLNKNILLLLTNFSNKTPPPKPVIGQTWFDNINNELKYYDEDWYTLAPPLVDLSQCIYSKNDTMSGNLEVSLTPPTPTSIASRSYVESKKVDYTYGKTDNINWILHGNKYTIMNTYATQNKQIFTLPFAMADTNYSILVTPNETTRGQYTSLHYTTFDKTVTGFTIDVPGTISTMSIVIMGFAA